MAPLVLLLAPFFLLPSIIVMLMDICIGFHVALYGDWDQSFVMDRCVAQSESISKLIGVPYKRSLQGAAGLTFGQLLPSALNYCKAFGHI